MKTLVKLILLLAVAFLAFKFSVKSCSPQVATEPGSGSVIGGSTSNGGRTSQQAEDIIKDLENELGVGGTKKAQTTPAPTNPNVRPTAEGTSNGHITFKGIPLGGSLNDFVSKLTAQGFSDLGGKEGVEVLQGSFAGYDNSIIAVTSTGGIVDEVYVNFPKRTTWQEMIADFDSLDSMLKGKYGEPSYSVRKEQQEYESVYSTTAGDITLTMIDTEKDEAYVQLIYADKAARQTQSQVPATTSNRNAADDL